MVVLDFFKHVISQKLIRNFFYKKYCIVHTISLKIRANVNFCKKKCLPLFALNILVFPYR